MPKVGGIGLPPGLDEDDFRDLYRTMYLIRNFEQTAERLHMEGELHGPFHSSMGQEAVAVGVCSVLAREDVITSTHRGHGHLLAKGVDPARMLAELAGRETGVCRGRSGSMHLADLSVGAIGENGIVGGSIFIGTGAALGFQREGSPNTAVAFFGDGAIGQGTLYECLNLASIWQLPVVFVCEDNEYAHSFPSRELANGGDLVARAESFGVPARRVDGTHVGAVRSATTEAVDRARAGEGPTLIQAKCYRWKGHNLGDAHHLYRERSEVRKARERDPLDVCKSWLRDHGVAVEFASIDEEVQTVLDDAWEFVLDSPASNPDELVSVP